jgi:gluconokinase
MSPLIIVLMGVSGSGKTTVGALLAGRLGCAFADADDFHSAANIDKMHAGIPLDDADRQPWLAAIAAEIGHWRTAGQCGVITCSALKRQYRDVIVGGRPGVRLVYLKGDKRLIARRMAARHGHFMPAALLDSQFETLEEPAAEEGALTIGIGKPPIVLVENIVAAIEAQSA